MAELCHAEDKGQEGEWSKQPKEDVDVTTVHCSEMPQCDVHIFAI